MCMQRTWQRVYCITNWCNSWRHTIIITPHNETGEEWPDIVALENTRRQLVQPQLTAFRTASIFWWDGLLHAENKWRFHLDELQYTPVEGQYWNLCGISGFCHEVDENCALLGCYAASCGNFLPTFRDYYRSYLQGSHSSLYKLRSGATGFLMDSWPLKAGSIGCPETSVRYLHYSLRNSPAERSSQYWDFFRQFCCNVKWVPLGRSGFKEKWKVPVHSMQAYGEVDA